MTTIQTKKGAICMILQATVTKYIPTNAYIYADNETKHGFLIDPGLRLENCSSSSARRG